MNLQGLLVQSSKWFGISSVQFSFLATSFSGKFVQFSSGHGGQVHPFSSEHSVQFTSSSGPDSDWPGWLGSVHWISNCLGGVRSSSRSPPAEIPARWPRVCHLDGDMVRFAGCACLPVRGVVWCRSHAIQFKIALKRVRSVHFACLIGSAASSFSSVSGTGAKCLHSVHSVQFTNSSGLGLDSTRAPLGRGRFCPPFRIFSIVHKWRQISTRNFQYLPQHQLGVLH